MVAEVQMAHLGDGNFRAGSSLMRASKCIVNTPWNSQPYLVHDLANAGEQEDALLSAFNGAINDSLLKALRFSLKVLSQYTIWR